MEIGRAVGATLGVLASEFPGIKVAGIDLEPQQIEFARRYLAEMGIDADLRVGDGANLPWEESSFDRQRPIDQFIVDFYCKKLMLAIEIDGSSHDSSEAQKRDAERQGRLESLGVRFLRFREEEVCGEVGGRFEGD